MELWKNRIEKKFYEHTGLPHYSAIFGVNGKNHVIS